MDLFLKFLIYGGKYLSHLTAQSIVEAYKRSLQLGKSVNVHCAQSVSVVSHYDNVLQMYNDNLQDYTANPHTHLAFISDQHRQDFETYLKDVELLSEEDVTALFKDPRVSEIVTSFEDSEQSYIKQIAISILRGTRSIPATPLEGSPMCSPRSTVSSFQFDENFDETMASQVSTRASNAPPADTTADTCTEFAKVETLKSLKPMTSPRIMSYYSEKQDAGVEGISLDLNAAKFLDQQSESFRELQLDISFKYEQMRLLKLQQEHEEAIRNLEFSEKLKAVQIEVESCTKLMNCVQEHFDVQEENNKTKRLMVSIDKIIKHVDRMSELMRVNDEHFRAYESLQNWTEKSEQDTENESLLMDDSTSAYKKVLRSLLNHQLGSNTIAPLSQDEIITPIFNQIGNFLCQQRCKDWEKVIEANQKAFEKHEKCLKYPLIGRWNNRLKRSRKSVNRRNGNKSESNKFHRNSHSKLPLGPFKKSYKCSKTLSIRQKFLQRPFLNNNSDEFTIQNIAALSSSWIKDDQSFDFVDENETDQPVIKINDSIQRFLNISETSDNINAEQVEVPPINLNEKTIVVDEQLDQLVSELMNEITVLGDEPKPVELTPPIAENLNRRDSRITYSSKTPDEMKMHEEMAEVKMTIRENMETIRKNTTKEPEDPFAFKLVAMELQPSKNSPDVVVSTGTKLLDSDKKSAQKENNILAQMEIPPKIIKEDTAAKSESVDLNKENTKEMHLGHAEKESYSLATNGSEAVTQLSHPPFDVCHGIDIATLIREISSEMEEKDANKRIEENDKLLVLTREMNLKAAKLMKESDEQKHVAKMLQNVMKLTAEAGLSGSVINAENVIAPKSTLLVTEEPPSKKVIIGESQQLKNVKDPAYFIQSGTNKVLNIDKSTTDKGESEVHSRQDFRRRMSPNWQTIKSRPRRSGRSYTVVKTSSNEITLIDMINGGKRCLGPQIDVKTSTRQISFDNSSSNLKSNKTVTYNSKMKKSDDIKLIPLNVLKPKQTDKNSEAKSDARKKSPAPERETKSNTRTNTYRTLSAKPLSIKSNDSKSVKSVDEKSEKEEMLPLAKFEKIIGAESSKIVPIKETKREVKVEQQKQMPLIPDCILDKIAEQQEPSEGGGKMLLQDVNKSDTSSKDGHVIELIEKLQPPHGAEGSYSKYNELKAAEASLKEMANDLKMLKEKLQTARLNENSSEVQRQNFEDVAKTVDKVNANLQELKSVKSYDAMNKINNVIKLVHNKTIKQINMLVNDNASNTSSSDQKEPPKKSKAIAPKAEVATQQQKDSETLDETFHVINTHLKDISAENMPVQGVNQHQPSIDHEAMEQKHPIEDTQSIYSTEDPQLAKKMELDIDIKKIPKYGSQSRRSDSNDSLKSANTREINISLKSSEDPYVTRVVSGGPDYVIEETVDITKDEYDEELIVVKRPRAQAAKPAKVETCELDVKYKAEHPVIKPTTKSIRNLSPVLKRIAEDHRKYDNEERGNISNKILIGYKSAKKAEDKDTENHEDADMKSGHSEQHDEDRNQAETFISVQSYAPKSRIVTHKQSDDEPQGTKQGTLNSYQTRHQSSATDICAAENADLPIGWMNLGKLPNVETVMTVNPAGKHPEEVECKTNEFIEAFKARLQASRDRSEKMNPDKLNEEMINIVEIPSQSKESAMESLAAPRKIPIELQRKQENQNINVLKYPIKLEPVQAKIETPRSTADAAAAPKAVLIPVEEKVKQEHCENIARPKAILVPVKNVEVKLSEPSPAPCQQVSCASNTIKTKSEKKENISEEKFVELKPGRVISEGASSLTLALGEERDVDATSMLHASANDDAEFTHGDTDSIASKSLKSVKSGKYDEQDDKSIFSVESKELKEEIGVVPHINMLKPKTDEVVKRKKYGEQSQVRPIDFRTHNVQKFNKAKEVFAKRKTAEMFKVPEGSFNQLKSKSFVESNRNSALYDLKRKQSLEEGRIARSYNFRPDESYSTPTHRSTKSVKTLNKISMEKFESTQKRLDPSNRKGPTAAGGKMVHPVPNLGAVNSRIKSIPVIASMKSMEYPIKSNVPVSSPSEVLQNKKDDNYSLKTRLTSPTNIGKTTTREYKSISIKQQVPNEPKLLYPPSLPKHHDKVVGEIKVPKLVMRDIKEEIKSAIVETTMKAKTVETPHETATLTKMEKPSIVRTPTAITITSARSNKNDVKVRVTSSQEPHKQNYKNVMAKTQNPQTTNENEDRNMVRKATKLPKPSKQSQSKLAMTKTESKTAVKKTIEKAQIVEEDDAQVPVVQVTSKVTAPVMIETDEKQVSLQSSVDMEKVTSDMILSGSFVPYLNQLSSDLKNPAYSSLLEMCYPEAMEQSAHQAKITKSLVALPPSLTPEPPVDSVVVATPRKLNKKPNNSENDSNETFLVCAPKSARSKARDQKCVEHFQNCKEAFICVETLQEASKPTIKSLSKTVLHNLDKKIKTKNVKTSMEQGNKHNAPLQSKGPSDEQIPDFMRLKASERERNLKRLIVLEEKIKKLEVKRAKQIEKEYGSPFDTTLVSVLEDIRCKKSSKYPDTALRRIYQDRSFMGAYYRKSFSNNNSTPDSKEDMKIVEATKSESGSLSHNSEDLSAKQHVTQVGHTQQDFRLGAPLADIEEIADNTLEPDEMSLDTIQSKAPTYKLMSEKPVVAELNVPAESYQWKLPIAKRKNLLPNFNSDLKNTKIVVPKTPSQVSPSKSTRRKSQNNSQLPSRYQNVLKRANAQGMLEENIPISSSADKKKHKDMKTTNQKIEKSDEGGAAVEKRSKVMSYEFNTRQAKRNTHFLKSIQDKVKKHMLETRKPENTAGAEQEKAAQHMRAISGNTNTFGKHLARLKAESEREKMHSQSAEEYQKQLTERLQALSSLPKMKEKVSTKEPKTFVYKAPVDKGVRDAKKPSLSDVKKTIIKHLRKSPMNYKRPMDRLMDDRKEAVVMRHMSSCNSVPRYKPKISGYQDSNRKNVVSPDSAIYCDEE